MDCVGGMQVLAALRMMRDDERVLIDGGCSRIVGGFGADTTSGERLRQVLQCRSFGALPLLQGPVRGLWLWYDDDAIPEPPAILGKPLNETATRLLGDQVCGGQLYGAVLVAQPEKEEE